MPLVPYVERTDVAEEKRHIFDHIEQTRAGIESGGMPRSFQLLMNSPDAAEAVAHLGEFIRLKCSLDPIVREIAILGVAGALHSQYEWAHHEPVARAVGVRDEVIEAIKSGRAPMGLPPKEGVFAQAAKELVKDGVIGERTFQAVEHLLGPSGAVDLLVVISYYAMLHRMLASLGIELEPHLKPLLPE